MNRRTAPDHMKSLLATPIRAALLTLPLLAGASPVGPIEKLVVTHNGIGPEQDGCRAFSVTPQQARAFLDQAVVTTMRQQHDHFLWGPCSARGTLTTRFGRWEWEIRNLGTGSLQAVTGEAFLLADPAAESLLSEGGAPAR